MTKRSLDYFMDSGLKRSYPATGITGEPTGTGINKSFRPGLKCTACGECFVDGDVARRSKNGYRHEICPPHAAGPILDATA